MNAQHDLTSPRRSRTRKLLSALPTVAVLVILGAIGAWGHRTGWKAPKVSQLIGAHAESEAEDWCVLHNVPDSICIACHPELVSESGADWCKEHGVPESRCTLCHPEILTTGVAGDWCREHGLPESGCTLCHPEIARKGEVPAVRDGVTISNAEPSRERSRADRDAFPTSLPLKRDPSTCQTHALKVQFASLAAMEKTGVRLGQVIERPMSDSIFANAEVDYDRTRHAKLAPRASGTVWSVNVELGRAVRAGDVLAIVEAPQTGTAKIQLLRAQAAIDVAKRDALRIEASSTAGFRTESERLAASSAVRQAELELTDARRALATLGFELPDGPVDETALAALGLPNAAVGAKAVDSRSLDLLPLVAPLDGIVVALDAVAGEVVDPTRTLFEIADPSRMWVTMSVPERDVRRIAAGERVLFRADDARDERINGLVTWIATSVDEATRTVQVRAEVHNRAGTLRAHTFGVGQVVVRTSSNAIAVPKESVQWEGCCFVVFVRLGDGIFQTRKVVLGAKDAAFVEIQAGVLPGEVVVTAGSHVLKSEILKSNLGAGCCTE